MENSITLKITRDDLSAYCDSASIYREQIHMPVPGGDGPYRVTYKLNSNGYYKVIRQGYTVTQLFPRGSNVNSPVCLLPDEWIGKRVSRKVTPIRRKKP